MDENLQAQIRQRMREKDTEDLLAIWTRADGEVWSDDAYAMARATLVERGIEPPEPVAAEGGTTARQADADDDDEDEDDDDLDEDTFHDPDRLLNMASWSATLSWFFLAGCVVILIVIVANVLALFAANAAGAPAAFSLFTLLLFGLVCGFLFVLGQAVAQALYILVDIYDTVSPVAEAGR